MNWRRYQSAGSFKQALEQRLRDQAIGDGVELARVRQLLVFDRFLARVVASLGDRMVLKGGLVVELRLARARTTKDIDLQLDDAPHDVLARLQEVGRLDLGDFLRFEVQDDPRHPEIEAEGMLYQGRRYRARAMLAGKIYGSSFGVDVVFAEPMTGHVEEIGGSKLLEFAGVSPSTFRIYPLETHIAEKLHAYTMPRKRPNSRVKDLPDMALLATVRALDAAELRSAYEHTFQARGTHSIPRALPHPPVEWGPVYERMVMTDDLAWRTLDELFSAVATFLDPLLAGSEGRWDPERWCWIGTELATAAG